MLEVRFNEGYRKGMAFLVNVCKQEGINPRNLSWLPKRCYELSLRNECYSFWAKMHQEGKLKNVLTNELVGHDYVEIGGLKWATMNVGADNVTDCGLYFQWGDTQGYTALDVRSGKKYFDWDDYKYFTLDTTQEGDAYKGGNITKYNSIDGKTVLDPSDDAVTANWGGSWHMPTTEELRVLCSAVNTAWTNDYQSSGVRGLVCTDKTDSSKVLFFPAVGFCTQSSVYNVDYDVAYWSSSLDSGSVSNARYLGFYNNSAYWSYYYYRCCGFAVRGVVG